MLREIVFTVRLTIPHTFYIFLHISCLKLIKSLINHAIRYSLAAIKGNNIARAVVDYGSVLIKSCLNLSSPINAVTPVLFLVSAHMELVNR